VLVRCDTRYGTCGVWGQGWGQAMCHRSRESVAEVLHCIRTLVEVWPSAPAGLQNASE